MTEDNGITDLLLGIALVDKGSFQEAITECRRALQSRSLNSHDTALAHGNIGSALMGLGRDAEAIEEYRAALNADPSMSFVRFNLGRAYVVHGQLDDAARAVRGSDPNESRRWPGRIFSSAACWRRRSSRMTRFVTSARRRGSSRMRRTPSANLAQALSQKGEIGAAILQWEKVVRLVPGDPAARNGLGINLARNARFDEAIREFREALKLKPGDEDSQANLEIALAQKAAGRKNPAP